MDKVRLVFVVAVAVLVFGGFGDEFYSLTQQTTFSGAHVRKIVDDWGKSPPMMLIVGLLIGYLLGHSGGGK